MCEEISIPLKYIKETDSLYKVINSFRSWQEVCDIFEIFSNEWIFRGQKINKWELIPSITRNMKAIDSDSFEPLLVDIAKDRVKNKPDYLPKTELGWRAFIQHYGGKTRLLDFTTDPYIATFFAFSLDQEKAQELEEECVVWAINKKWLEQKASQKIEQKLGCKMKNDNFAAAFETIIKTGNFFPMICPFIADWDDRRVKSQKSIFLCQCDPSNSFEFNLCYDQTGDDYEEVDIDYKKIESYIIKILIPTEFKGQVIKNLEDKNIDKKTMLPGENEFQDMENIIRDAEVDAIKRREEFLDKMRKRREIDK